MKCGSCVHMRVPQTGMSRFSFGNCAKAPAWKFFSLRFDRECGKHQVATAIELENKRKEWRRRNGNNRF